MKRKYSISLYEIKTMLKQINEINKTPLEDITFLNKNGKPIKINNKIIADFKFIGLNNIDFIKSGFYKTGLK